jgi:hypothetical protein
MGERLNKFAGHQQAEAEAEAEAEAAWLVA